MNNEHIGTTLILCYVKTFYSDIRKGICSYLDGYKMRQKPSIYNMLLQASPFQIGSHVGVIFTTMVSSSHLINFTALSAQLSSAHTALLMSVAHPGFSVCHVLTQSIFLSYIIN